MKTIRIISTLVLLLSFGSVFAEQELTLEQAMTMIDAACEKAIEIGVPMSIAIVDEGGNLLAFARMTDAPLISLDISIDKAWTALAVKAPTAVLADLAAPGGGVFGAHTTNNGRVVIFGGGIPVVVNDRVISGIGVSGGSVKQDIMVAESGLATLE